MEEQANLYCFVSYNDNIVHLYDLPTYGCFTTITRNLSSKSKGILEECCSLFTDSREQSVLFIAVSCIQLHVNHSTFFASQVFRKKAALFKGGSKSFASGTRWSIVFWRQSRNSQGLAMDWSSVGSRWRLMSYTRIKDQPYPPWMPSEGTQLHSWGGMQKCFPNPHYGMSDLCELQEDAHSRLIISDH